MIIKHKYMNLNFENRAGSRRVKPPLQTSQPVFAPFSFAQPAQISFQVKVCETTKCGGFGFRV